MAKHKWQPGQSGNPAGRPKKERAWTAILERAGGRTEELDGKNIARKRIIAEMVMQVAATGKATFPDGTTLEIAPKDWLDFVKWLYVHIDGPAKQEIEHSGPDGEAIPIRIIGGVNLDNDV